VSVLNLCFRGLLKILICECIKFCGYKFLCFQEISMSRTIKSGVTSGGHLVSSTEYNLGGGLSWILLQSHHVYGHFKLDINALEKMDTCKRKGSSPLN